jgi:hypothetical protein
MPMTRFLLCVAVVAAALQGGCAATRTLITGGDKVEELMRKSGAWKQMAEHGPMVQLGIAQENAQARAQRNPRALSDAELARLNSAVAAAYNADRLRKEFRARLPAELAAADREKALAWFSSDLGRRIAALEEKSGEREGLEERQRATARLMAGLPLPRIGRFKRLTTATRCSFVFAEAQIQTSSAIASAIARLRPARDQPSPESLKRELEAQKDRIVATFAQLCTAEAAYTYRALSDAEVDRYIEFTESPEGRRYNAAMFAVLNMVLAKAALDIASELGK